MKAISTSSPILSPILEFVQRNPLVSVWHGIMFCGGAVLLFYHASIGYLPDFSLPDLAGLLASITLVGLFLVLFLTSACLLPGGFLTWFEGLKDSAVSDKRLFRGRKGYVLLVFPVIYWGIVLGLPFVLQDLSRQYDSVGLKYDALLLVISCILVSFLMHHYSDEDQSAPSRKSGLKEVTWLSVALGAWTIFFFIPLYTVIKLAEHGDTQQEIFVLYMGITLFSTLNIAAYATGFRSWPAMLAAGSLVVVFILPMCSQRPLIWPQLVVRALALGDRHADEIILSGKECRAFAKFGVACTSSVKDESQIAIRNVNVLSRVGTSVLLEILVSSEPSESKESILRTADFDRYCPGAKNTDARIMCSRCDSSIQANTVRSDKQNAKLAYRKSLVCAQLSVPKDQVANISWSGDRSYKGYTEFSTTY